LVGESKITAIKKKIMFQSKKQFPIFGEWNKNPAFHFADMLQIRKKKKL
jgi:hypothetical protein